MWTALFEKMPPVKVIDESIDYKDYINLDLSVGNTDLELVNADDAAAFGRYLNKYLLQHRAKVAYGGYNENAACTSAVQFLKMTVHLSATSILDWTFGRQRELLFWRRLPKSSQFQL